MVLDRGAKRPEAVPGSAGLGPLAAVIDQLAAREGARGSWIRSGRWSCASLNFVFYLGGYLGRGSAGARSAPTKPQLAVYLSLALAGSA